jgi:ribonuclease BN (tRNA processing enzyme)
VHGEADKLDAVRQHLFNATIFPVEPPFRQATLNGPCQLAGSGVLTHFPLVHPGGSLGFRLDWPGHSLAYVTDTTARTEADYVAKIAGVNLLVHECYFADNDRNLPAITGHSWLRPVVEVASAAKVGRLVLVHIGPHYDRDEVFDLAAARRVFRNTELGVDGGILEF